MALLGYGVVEGDGSRHRALAYGALSTPARMPLPERLLRLHQGVRELIEGHRPDVVAVEELFFGRNVTTAFTVGQARGVVLLAAAQAGIPLAEYTPMQVKQAVTGWGRADKAQVQQMVARLLGLGQVPKPDDVADALAVALTCLCSHPFSQRLEALAARQQTAERR
ncbi:MAG: crossover junction endodeoxyribonuclease RuvC [Firmicutes bacterium]|nr:crossover junction endodeoxyribonuclease RuvC [Bacillota bacterium]